MVFLNNRIFRLLRLFRRAFGEYRRQIAVMAGLNFLSGILEGIGINAIIPLFAFIDGAPADGFDAVSRFIADFFHFFGFTYTLKYLLIFIMALFILKAVFLYVSQYITVAIVADYEKKIRSDLFRLMLKGSWPYLSRQRVGHLDQLLITDVKHASALLDRIGGMFLIATNLIVYSVIALNISSAIAAFALVVGGAIFLVFKPLFYKNRIASAEISHKNKELAHDINESIVGIKTIKSLRVENPVFEKGLAYFERMKELYIRVALLKSLTNVLLQPIGLFFVIGIFALFYKANMFTFASFAVIVYAVNRVFAGIQLAQSHIHTMSSQAPYLMNVLAYAEEAARNTEEDAGTKKFHFRDRIELRGVSFSYDDHENAVSDLTFSIRKGEMIGLIGRCGAGKTTLVDLLLRLLKPKKGIVLLDGENIENISIRDWRMRVGYVSQDVFLLNDTIENNIRFYDRFMSQEDVVSATKSANIHDFIVEQPKGLQTAVGERGMQLSGGQRQRIALARVLARKPDILILDEGTSALDNESESLIQRSIEQLKGRITVIAIAHRLSTVIHSDRLFVLENGNVIEEGAPAALLENKGSYFSKAYHLRT